MSREELKRNFAINAAVKSEAIQRSALLCMKSMLLRELEKIEESVRVEYTGWFALMKFNRVLALWECVLVFDPDEWDGELPDFDVSLPIPKPETIPEFNGF